MKVEIEIPDDYASVEMPSEEIWKKFLLTAYLLYGGHFTLLKFTTNWRCCFGTLNPKDDMEWYNLIHLMPSGKTAEEAMEKAQRYRVDCYMLERAVEKFNLPDAINKHIEDIVDLFLTDLWKKL